jgi:ribosomal-protein-alanine N-acetyltransferase
MEGMPPASLRTPRLLLRPWRPEDLPAFADLNADPEVMRFFPALRSRAESDALAMSAMAAMEARGWGSWAVERPGLAPFIGFIGLSEPDFPAPFAPCVEIGWRLAKAHWGLGLAPEGARAVLEHAFGALGLAEVVSFTSTLNAPSMRVMEKVGMTRDPDGDFDHPKIPEGHPLRRHVLYRIRAGAKAGLP